MIRRSEAIALLECMAQNALGAFASANGQEKESAAQHYKALDMAIAELKRAEGDTGPFVRPDNLGESEFLIVERHCVEVYSKGEYLPTPMPKDCIAAPMNPWIRTNDQPPTEMDACHNDWVLALAAYQSPDNPVRLPAADIVDWNFPVNCPELYPYWMPLPKLPEVDDD